MTLKHIKLSNRPIIGTEITMSCHGSRQKWKFNDGELPEDVIKLRDQSLNIKNITRKHRGLYTCSGHRVNM